MPALDFHVGRLQDDLVALVFRGDIHGDGIGARVDGLTVVDVKNAGARQRTGVGRVFQFVPDDIEVPNIDRKGGKGEQHEKDQGNQNRGYSPLVFHRITDDYIPFHGVPHMITTPSRITPSA